MAGMTFGGWQPSNPNEGNAPQLWTNPQTGQQAFGTIDPFTHVVKTYDPRTGQPTGQWMDPAGRTGADNFVGGASKGEILKRLAIVGAIPAGAALISTLAGGGGAAAAGEGGAAASTSGTAAGAGTGASASSAGLFSNPWLTALGIGSNLGASLIQANAAKSASAQQQAAAQQAIGLQRDIFNQTQANLAPFRQAGAGAVGKLSDIFGLGGR